MRTRLSYRLSQISILWNLPYILLHLGAIYTCFTYKLPTSLVITMILFYAVRMFWVTGFYHRYFSHRTYKTSRAFQFVMAFLGILNLQKGPIWWASHHRHHHACSDEEVDPHSPHQHGFFWSHLGWFMTKPHRKVYRHYGQDFMKYPEIVFLDRFHGLGIVPLAAICLILSFLACPEDVSGGFMWLFFVNTVIVYHMTYSINSLAHKIGNRAFPTSDHSKNNWLLAIFTLGEGWHNNHHYYPRSTRQGFKWYQIDISYYCLKILEKCHLIHSIKEPPKSIVQGK